MYVYIKFIHTHTHRTDRLRADEICTRVRTAHARYLTACAHARVAYSKLNGDLYIL